MARYRLFSGAIPAAETYLSDVISGLTEVGDLFAQCAFDYGSGGTSIKAYVQTSLDGATWIDLVCFAPANADTTRYFDVNAGASIADNVAATDGSLTDNTSVDGIMGDQLRLKLVVVGTYVASSLVVYVETKTGLAGSGTGAVSIADGADVAQGSTADAAATAGSTGTVSAKLRTISASIGAVADAAWVSGSGSVIAALKAIAGKIPALGQAAAAASLPVVVTTAELTGLTAGSLNADLVPSTDVSAYKAVYLQVLGTFSGTLTFQGSEDNSTFVSVVAVGVTSLTLGQITSTAITGIYEIPVRFKFLRVRMTAYSSGTATGAATLSGLPAQPHALYALAVQNGTWVIQPTTSGGLASFRNIDLGDTGQVVKASAGQVYAIAVSNNHATLARYLKLYNKATAPVAGDTPVHTFMLPPLSARDISLPAGLVFAAGIGVRAVTEVTDAGTTSPATNDVVCNVMHK